MTRSLYSSKNNKLFTCQKLYNDGSITNKNTRVPTLFLYSSQANNYTVTFYVPYSE